MDYVVADLVIAGFFVVMNYEKLSTLSLNRQQQSQLLSIIAPRSSFPILYGVARVCVCMRLDSVEEIFPPG